MKTKVLVLVPYTVPPDRISDYVHSQLLPHWQCDDETPIAGRFDYLVGPLDNLFNDPISEGRLPPSIRRAYAGNICEMQRLPADVEAAAVVTSDGAWSDIYGFGWKLTREPSDENSEAWREWDAHFRELLSHNADCWVVAVWAHS